MNAWQSMTCFSFADPEGFNEIVPERAASSPAQQGGTSSIICSTRKGCMVAWQHKALKQKLTNVVRFYEKILFYSLPQTCLCRPYHLEALSMTILACI